MAFGRVAARLLMAALRNPHVQAVTIEVSRYAARRATAALMRYLRAGSKTYNDESGAKRVSGPAF